VNSLDRSDELKKRPLGDWADPPKEMPSHLPALRSGLPSVPSSYPFFWILFTQNALWITWRANVLGGPTLMATRAQAVLTLEAELPMADAPDFVATAPLPGAVEQGLTLVHFSAHRKHNSWETSCA
jgi:hypothetical protein